ncbi:nucleotide sugar dehydrogenase [Halovenus sp. HT40]|uniref:nucleotide sugar dehydrogenase n=1 Tax=Halovenus sp. HT40 TaxID=3126691 RepID=UPI00300EFE14
MSSVCVHGLGYVGLPTAAMLANNGHDVFGYDVDEAVRDILRSGDTHIKEPRLRAFVTQALSSDKLEITDELVPAEYQIICVPTPFDDTSKSADLSYVQDVGRAIAPSLREGDTVILESTVPPGTTTDELQPLLEASGLVAGEDFALAYSPETVLPGNVILELRENNRIVGGVNEVSAESAVRLYDSFVTGKIRVTCDPTVAEFIKLIQNTSRDVSIAFANETARLAHDYNIKSREAIKLANEHPRVNILQPGPGVGGHCLPIDPWFLDADSDELNLISTAREVNNGMVEFVCDLLRQELNAFDQARIAVLGIAYKGNVSDTRMSPGLRLAQELTSQEQTALATDGGSGNCPEVVIQDPHVTDPDLELTDLKSATEGADALVITADHDEYKQLDPSAIIDRMEGNVVVDTKALLESKAWHEAGFILRIV